MKVLSAFPQPARKWFVLSILPLLCTIVGFLLFGLAALISALAGSGGTLQMVSNTFSILGVISFVIGLLDLLLVDMWIVLFAKALRYDPMTHTWRLSKTAAIVFALIFGFWAWLYTYERDKWKFWVNLALFLVTLTLWSMVGWIWTIIDLARRPAAYFEQFPHETIATLAVDSANRENTLAK